MGLAQIITTTRGGTGTWAVKGPPMIQSERRNSIKASFSAGFSLSNFLVT
jgi:hypothetical protein